MKFLRPALILTAAVILLAMAAPVASAAQFKAADFDEPSYCNGCHSTLYSQWEGSMHAKAVTDDLFQKTMAFAAEDLGGSETPEAQAIQAFCFRCHSPIGTMIGDIPPKTAAGMAGISCDFCHTVSGTTGIGNGSFINTPGDVKRGPYVDAVSPVHETTLSVLHTQSEFCGMCHDVFHPTNGLQLEATYTEWKNGPYAAENVQCQHCMMGEMKKTRAASQGPIREVVFGHAFAGGNFVFGEKDEAKKLLLSAARVEVTADRTNAKPGDKIFVTVKVTNSGAGHMLPTGLTEARDMWLEVKGVSTENKSTSILEERYGTVLEDAAGKHDGTVPVWRAVKIFSDNRIGPRETKTYEKSFTIPAGMEGQYKIVANLNYRSANEKTTEHLGMKTLPSMTIASGFKKVMLPGGDAPASEGSGVSPWLIWGGIGLVMVIVFAGSVMLLRGSRGNA